MTDKNLIEYYRLRAPEYEQIYYRAIPQRRLELDDEANRLQKLVQNKRVLDLACGTGYWTQIMSKTAQSIVAVDIAEEMLTEAKSKQYRCEVQFVCGNLYAPPVKPGSFDIIALGFWFSHEPKEQYVHFVNHVKRLTGDKGQIWLIDNNPPAEGQTSDIVRTDKHGNTYKRRLLSDGTEHVILKNYFSEQELRELFSEYCAVQRLTFEKYYWSAVLAPLRSP